MKNMMNETIKENNNSSFENSEIDSSLTFSEQNNDISYSYNNMSCIESFLDSDDNEDNNNFEQFLDNQKLTQNNPNIQNNNNLNNELNNINLNNGLNNINLNNGFNNINYNQIQQFQQLYSLYYYNQCLNKQIQEFKLIQILMNILNNNKRQNIQNVKYHKQMKKKKNNEKKENVNTKKPKPENEIKIPLIFSGEEKRTFVKLSPIPHKYSPFDIVMLIDRYLKTKKGQRIYNSIYVPLTKGIGKNKGYCFINLVSPKYVVKFYNVFNGLLFKTKNIKKCCTVVFSDNQNVDCSNEDAFKRPIIFKDTINN